ncbi:hypothetical protein DY000_02018986 [Brassica cretica]|uniref:Uncharacterized protein n=1 Tax=Brassica cretica TaxID=69181 RepID=A0ABQ7CQF0_BRACR|nr:hypothetical protein DY000_02018986 [Brassica cretica]
MNYLSPNVKRGNFTDQEEDLIIRLHKLLGRFKLELSCVVAVRLTDNSNGGFDDLTVTGDVKTEAGAKGLRGIRKILHCSVFFAICNVFCLLDSVHTLGLALLCVCIYIYIYICVKKEEGGRCLRMCVCV